MLPRLPPTNDATARKRLAVPAAALLAMILLTAFSGTVAADGGHGGTFPTAGNEAQREITDLYVLVGWMSIVISIVVLGVLVYIIAKYRTSHDDESEGSWFTHNNTLEITWTLATAIVLIYLGVVTAQAMDRMGTAAPLEDTKDQVDIAVIGTQFSWQYVYPDGSNTFVNLHIEEGQTFRLHVASCDVIHSFYVPNLGIKLDTSVVGDEACESLRNAEVPDRPRINSLDLKAEAGTYGVQCAEFCGAGHHAMKGEIIVFEKGTRERSYGLPVDKGEVRHVEIADEDGNTTLTPSTLNYTRGDLTTWIVHNNGTSSHTLDVPAPYNLTTEEIATGATADLRFTADTAGSWNVTVDDQPVATLNVSGG